MAKSTKNKTKFNKSKRPNKSNKRINKTKKRINKSNKRTKKSKNNNIINTGIKTTKGIKPVPRNWYQYNFWDIMFNPYFIKHDYMDEDYIFARLIIYKEPKNDIRGFIKFFIDGLITLNRTDKKGVNSVHRITVGIGDKIVFLVDRSQSKYPTIVDYLPQYQQEIKQNKTGIHDPDQEFRIVSDDRIKDIRSIFSWLRLTTKPEYLKDILTRVEIIKGVKLLEKEKMKLSSNHNSSKTQIGSGILSKLRGKTVGLSKSGHKWWQRAYQTGKNRSSTRVKLGKGDY